MIKLNKAHHVLIWKKKQLNTDNVTDIEWTEKKKITDRIWA